MLKSYDLFFFDLDGLLVNTEELHFEAYKTLCNQHGFALLWTFEEYCGIAHKSGAGLRNALYVEFPPLERLNWDELYREKKELYMEILKRGSVSLMPGAKELLGELAENRGKRCVVTNSTREQVEELKKAQPILKTIPVWVTRELYERAKPAPDGYLHGFSLLADPGDRCVGFEDTLKGVKALEGAGIEPVLICPAAHPQLAEAGHVTHYNTLKEFSLASV